MIKIRQATIQDAKDLSELSEKSFLPAHGHSASKEDIENYISKNFSVENCKEELADPKNKFYFIELNGQLAGYSKVLFDTPYKEIKASNITYMSRLYLLEEFYGQNLGADLFDFNVTLSKKHNQGGIWLAVWIENPRAIAFYKKMGFKIVGSYDFQISETHSNPNHIMYLEYSK